MIFQQYFLACLSHASYLIGDESSGRAVVVDPQRDVDGYLDDAAKRGLRIERVIETHFHADFVSGHLELAAATGAIISFGAEAAETDFAIERLHDAQRLSLGEVQLEIRATPGHTPESISIVVFEGDGDGDGDVEAAPFGVLTGDTLFIGDVGRPDLLGSLGFSAADMARRLYHSLHERLLDLPDVTKVFPAHGAGSACGRSLSTETSSTIGEQRRTNYALAPMSEDDFVALVTEGQPLAPLYFPFSAHRNRERHVLLGEHDEPAALSLDDVLERQCAGAVVLDTRDPADFAAGHLARSINVGLAGRFAEYAGDVLRPTDQIVLVCDDGHEMEAKLRLGRIGFDNVDGFLAEPARVLQERPDLAVRSSRLTAIELAERLRRKDNVVLLDVRNPGEVAEGAIAGATNVPLPRLLDHLDEIAAVGDDHPVVVYCAGGYRSAMAASVIAAAGHHDVSDLLGGYGAWQSLVRPH